MIQIITDSTTDLDKRILENYDLITLPLTITIDNRNYLDGVDIHVEEVYRAMRNGIVPKTSQIPYDYIYNTFSECVNKGQDVIYIAFSTQMSSCYSLASTIAEELMEQNEGARITVVDSEGGSSATGLIVWQALKLAKSGMEYDELLEAINEMIKCVVHVFSVADLEWMAKGGRIIKPVGYLGSLLKIQPWLMVDKGRMVVRGMVRGRNKAIDKVVEETCNRAKDFPDQLIAITHADDIEAAKELEAKIKVRMPECSTTICHIGGVLGVHIGISGIGVFFFAKRPKNYSK